MPELPEVETIVRGLRAHVVGRRISEVELRRLAIRFPIPPAIAFAARRRVLAVERHSKYILLVLDDGARILVHLGMSGRLHFHLGKNYAPQKHDHVLIRFGKSEAGAGGTVVFNDARRFGVVDYLSPSQESHRLLQTLGIDPLSRALTPRFLLRVAAGRATSMKNLLMDQKHIAGLGNIYVCEALFHARILPTRAASTLTEAEAKRLVPAIRRVLNEAIDAGGSTLRDYVQLSGEIGYFQNSHAVYGREGQPCTKCGAPVARLVQAGRSSFFCPDCQG